MLAKGRAGLKLAALEMIAAAAKRVWNAPTAWYWAFNFLRLGSGVILLPLLNLKLTKADVGMHTLFMSLYSLVAILDMVFSPTLGRMIGYALGGAREVKAFGIGEQAPEGGKPNFTLVGQIMQNSIRLYRVMLLPLMAGLALYGTWVIYDAVPGTSNPRDTWVAWTALVIAAPLEFYTGVWGLFLRSLDHVLLAARLLTFLYLTKFVISAGLLLAGFGLLSIPIATLATALVQRIVLGGAAKRRFPAEAKTAAGVNLFPAIWPTSWRTGVQILSGYFCITSLGNIVEGTFGLAQQAEYGISVTVVGIVQTMATMWLFVKWPVVAQLRARNETGALRLLMRERVWRQLATFVAGFGMLLLLGPTLLTWVGIQKNLLPQGLLCLLALWTFLEMHMNSWTTFLATENRIPSMWPVTITNIGIVVLAFVLAKGTDWGVGGVIAAPLIAGMLFNFWFWPRAGAANIGRGWFALMFGAQKDLAK